MPDEITIRIRDNGPLIVRGGVKLIDGARGEFPEENVIALCRCGHSSNKPFCDGAHETVGFKSEPRASKDQE